ncbi:MAG: ComF family protein [Ignavibacteria bacterium]|nr:ComF family protein [Ignavibacteria bacterium]
MSNNINQFFDFFLPRYCTGCYKKLTYDEKFICPNCLNSILKADNELIKAEYTRKFKNDRIIEDFSSLYIFESDKAFQNIIHSIKYNKKFLAGILLGRLLAEALEEKINTWKIDLIIPVPLHQLKKSERGYNQSEYIAKGISKRSRIKMQNNAISRVRYTQSQTTMTLKEREQNIENAFKVKRKKNIKGKTLLLVDDVITTGATVKECGKVLKDSGANTIYACSTAIAE